MKKVKMWFLVVPKKHPQEKGDWVEFRVKETRTIPGFKCPFDYYNSLAPEGSFVAAASRVPPSRFDA